MHFENAPSSQRTYLNVDLGEPGKEPFNDYNLFYKHLFGFKKSVYPLDVYTQEELEDFD